MFDFLLYVCNGSDQFWVWEVKLYNSVFDWSFISPIPIHLIKLTVVILLIR